VVAGAESDLGLLVHNLLDNAIRYTPSGGQVHVTLAPQNGSAVLRVDDTGIGIPSRDLDRIFERFYRVDQARSRRTGGTGLGLAIVREVARAHGGDVTLSEGPLGGLRVEVRFPNGQKIG
jgi:two-component system sensor histidine kinase VicK